MQLDFNAMQLVIGGRKKRDQLFLRKKRKVKIMTFDQKLKTLRKEHSFSQEEFAQQLNVSRQAVSKWESGQGFPEIDKLKQISTMFGVTLDYLLKDDYQEGEPPNLGHYISREMIDGFLSYKRQGAKRITLGICLIVFSNFFNSILDYSQMAMILYWITNAIAFALLIWHALQPKRYNEIGTKRLLFDDVIIKEFRAEHEKNRKRYIAMIVVGVFIFFLSQIIAQISIDYSDDIQDALSWVLQAAWIALFILPGLSIHAENMIAYNTEYRSKKSKKNKFLWVYLALPVTVIGVIIGIVTNAWNPVVPIIALFCILLITVCKLLIEGRGSNE